MLLFENKDDRNSFQKYYTLNVKIKGLNVLIDSKTFFETPMINKEEGCEKNFEMGRNIDYTIVNLLG